MKKILISFLLIITLFCNCSVSVYASDISGGGYARKWSGWTEEERKAFCRDKLTGAILQRVGVIIQPDKWTSEEWTNAWYTHLAEIETASSMTYDEYIMSLISVDEENDEFIISDTLLDDFYSVANIYIENETGWSYGTSFTPEQLYSKINHKEVYDVLVEMCNSLNDDEIMGFSSCMGATGTKYYAFIKPLKYDGLVGTFYDVDGHKKMDNARPFYEWEVQYCNLDKYYYSDGTFWETVENYSNTFSISFVNSYRNPMDNNSYSRPFVAVSKTPRTYRVYKSIDDYKAYSIGTRPYYVTENFTNYDSTIDNSTTITQTEIDNSVTYGDVYNYITNNYDNPDGLSEDELRAILAEYLTQINNNNSGGSGSGSDDSGSSGGGLLDFLSGLGSIGDALLSILGKLLEYIGKALELLTGTVTKVLDLIPSNITNLLLGLFPFIPQEWVTAIELSLVLGVVLAVVGAFKK